MSQEPSPAPWAEKTKDFYLPDLSEADAVYMEWVSAGRQGDPPGLATFISVYQPRKNPDAIFWRAHLQQAANEIAQSAIDSLM